MLEYSADGYHYFPESKAPLKMKSKECEFHGFQPRVPLKKKKKKSEFENGIQNFCDTFIVEKHLLLKYLKKKKKKIKPEKREHKKKLSKEQN